LTQAQDDERSTMEERHSTEDHNLRQIMIIKFEQAHQFKVTNECLNLRSMMKAEAKVKRYTKAHDLQTKA